MAYESVIGENQLIYNVTLSTSETLVSDLLVPSDLQELNNWPVKSGTDRTLTNVVVLDGSIFCQNSSFEISHKIGGAIEPFTAESTAFFPYLDWHKKVYIKAAAEEVAIIKFVIGFTKRP